MPRVLHHGNYGVYVGDERGAPHHSPHAHVKERGRRIASVHLITLSMIRQVAPVPGEVIEMICEHQETLLEAWEELNS